MNLNSKQALVARLRRGPRAREAFVESHVSKAIVQQLRATREHLDLSQEDLARKAGMTQNAISRLESSDYGRPTITTLKRLAAALDVGLIVHLVPFSQIIDWVSGTPRVEKGLRTESLAVSSFEMEEREGVYDRAPLALVTSASSTVGDPNEITNDEIRDNLSAEGTTSEGVLIRKDNKFEHGFTYALRWRNQ